MVTSVLPQGAFFYCSRLIISPIISVISAKLAFGNISKNALLTEHFVGGISLQEKVGKCLIISISAQLIISLILDDEFPSEVFKIGFVTSTVGLGAASYFFTNITQGLKSSILESEKYKKKIGKFPAAIDKIEKLFLELAIEKGEANLKKEGYSPNVRFRAKIIGCAVVSLIGSLIHPFLGACLGAYSISSSKDLGEFKRMELTSEEITKCFKKKYPRKEFCEFALLPDYS